MKVAQVLARASLLASSIIIAGAFMPAAAQTLTPSPQELNPAERAPAAMPNAGRNDILAPPEPGACPLRSSDLKLTLQAVTFTGTEGVSPQELMPAYAPFVGHEVPIFALCDIRDRAAEILFRKGLLARVEIPQQRIVDGKVNFEVIEAYLASVRVTGDIGLAQSKVEDYIEMLRGMRPFDLSKAQRYLLLASDVPGVRIAATLRPSNAGRGAVDLEVNVTREAVGAVANVQNFGSHEMGPFGGLVRTDFNSFTSLGERTSVILYSTLDGNEQRVAQATEELRFGPEGWLARLSLAYGEMRPGGSLAPLMIRGNSFVGSIGGSYPLVRSRAFNLNIVEGLDYIDQKIDVFGSTLSDDSLRVLYLGVNADRSWLTTMPVAVNGAITLRKGFSGLGSSRAGDPNLSRAEGDPDAFVFRGDASATVKLLAYFAGTLRMSGQYADVPLLSYEEMPIGNLTIGRGYDPSVLSGDRGIGGSLQFDVGNFVLPRSAGLGQIGFFAFGDIARIDNLDTGSIGRTLHSVGAGVAFQFAGRLRLDLTYAHPLDKLFDTAPKRPDSRVLINLIVRS